MPAVPDTPPLTTTEPIAQEVPHGDTPTRPAPTEQAAPAESSAGADGDAAPAPTELAPAECAARLAELFPALFAAIPNTPPRPIKLRIQADIQQRAPGQFTRRSLSPFLHRHTTSTAYLKALVASPHRFDLDGAPAGEVNDEHRQAAVAELEHRRALHEARRAAQRQAQRGKTPAQADTPDAGSPAQTLTDRPAPGRPPHRDSPPRAQHRDDSRRAHERAASPPRPARPPLGPRQPPHTPPARETHAGAVPQRDASPAAQSAIPTVDDSGRRERALLLRAFETSTLSRANFCALKRIDPTTLDALLEQARGEGASAQPGSSSDGARRAAPRRPAR